MVPDGDESLPHRNDTWTYNLTTDSWTNRTPAFSPPGTCNHAMAYDNKNGVIVLFGGWTSVLTSDTWIYNPGTNKWTKMPATGDAHKIDDLLLHIHHLVFKEVDKLLSRIKLCHTALAALFFQNEFGIPEFFEDFGIDAVRRSNH